MRYGIISDIHGNLEALEAILKELKKEGVERFLMVGDVVGYGANPKECIEIVRELPGITGVAGNHDWGVLEKTPLEYFNLVAKEALIWTKDVLKEMHLKFLEKLPLMVEEEDFTLVHATLEAPQEWRYIYSTYEAHRNMDLQNTRVCFCGHSHIPIFFFQNEHVFFGREEVLEIKEGYKYLINVGSVGQPRDGDPRACAVIYDTEKKVVKYIRKEYNISRAQEKIWEEGLPRVLGIRLEYGE
ncbi:metallophosphoesterase family protein [Candidatus Calescamantes bacterium]|nr:metallophosphoesterase family protein [Candidatus Calescamantes bacterium]